MDSNACTDGRLDTLNGVMVDGPDTASPYIVTGAQLAVMGLAIDLDSGVTYQLAAAPFEFGNNPTTIDSVQFFDALENKTWTATTAGFGTIPVVFNNTGVHTINVTVWSNNIFNVKNQLLKVRPGLKVTSVSCQTDTIGFWSAIGFQGYDEPIPAIARGTYQVFYSNIGDCHLHKPVVILDGYDPGSKRTIDKLYSELLSYNNNTANFGDDLRNTGYDVVILDFPVYQVGVKRRYIVNPAAIIPVDIKIYRDGGSDFIERNAFVLVRLIQELNDQLVANGSGDETIALVGPSMGGQISRFALTYMESHPYYFNSMNHNTRLWISFDSPHWGADIPLGFQEMIRYLGIEMGNADAYNTYAYNLRTPAARQMLIHQTETAGPFWNPSGYISAMNDGQAFRTNWKNTLNTIGFPSNCRNVAICNGSYTGGNFYSPGSKMFQLNALISPVYGTPIPILAASAYFMKGSPSMITAFAYSPIAVKKVLPGIASYTLAGKTTLPYGPIDACPGGLFPVQQIFADQARSMGMVFRGVVSAQFLSAMTYNTSFIPTVSALALYDPNFHWSNSLDRSDILCNWKTPFENIYMPSENEGHVQITPANAEWAIEEIIKGTKGCAPICITGINGDADINRYDTKTYTLNGTPPTGTTTWWDKGADLSVVSSNSSSITVYRTAYTGDTWVSAIIDNPCGANVYVKKDMGGHAKMSPPPDTTRTDTSMAENIKVFPNPSQNVWNITGITGDFSAAVYDVTGRKEWEYVPGAVSSKTEIDNRSMAKGVYYLKYYQNGKRSTVKLLKL